MQFIITKISGICEDALWIAIISLTKYGQLRCEIRFQHSLSYKKGGFVSLRYNYLRKIATFLIDQVCQTSSSKKLDSRSTNVRDESRLDISARGFWTKYQMAFFDVMNFDLKAKRQLKNELSHIQYDVMNSNENTLFNDEINHYVYSLKSDN